MVTKLVKAQGLFLLILVGGAAWLFTALGDFSSRVACLVEQVIVIKTVKGQAGANLAEFSAAFPQDQLDQLQQGAGLLALLVILPAAVIFVFQTTLVICALRTKKGASASCTKMIICILTIFCILGFVFYLIVGGIGIVSTSAEAQAADAEVRLVCDGEIPKARAQVTDSQNFLDSLKAAGATSDQLGGAQYEVDQADIAITAIETACECLSGLLASLAALVAPAIICAVICLILLILDCCTCCALGCCSPPKGTPQGNLQKVGV